MKKSSLALFLSSALLVPAAAFAAGDATGYYIGGGYTMANYDQSHVSDDASLGLLSVRGGYQVDENLALEARLGTGVSDDKISIDGEKTKIEEDYTYGAYLKMGQPTSIGLYPYMLVGWTESKIKGSVPGASQTDKSGGISYGAGMEYRFSDISVGLEYTVFYNNDDYKIDGLTLGATYKF